ncbi:TetR/AcrR family transcriptional regulator [Cuneatibacter sp. NSJ-177]|uniref:TetR/AcrR family transcriptional regulator n=1 Tax=Cuneatibacter sp. NSJ-177 TaxID=2931401 RepID=UPI001FCFBB37|nr:TetR/AcrR family transcriptional regulator [Cuneatibacter sp. NSJ-177]MCJ7836582.1 TetR/AcrR family transcriptional regulator [Cuneatibacter sp. NSJ-177]
MDRRQQKSRDAIFTAFGKLLSQKSYGKITVQEIIDEANVGRSTFYAHFQTKDDLLREMCTDIFHHVFSDHLDTENTHDFSLAHGDPRTAVTHILYHLRDNKKNIAGILSCESGELFLQFFREYLNAQVTESLLGRADRKNVLVPEAFLRNHIAGSFINLVQWWIQNGWKETPEKLAKYFLAVIEPVI